MHYCFSLFTHVLCRFLIECRYNKHGIAQQPVASVGYMVKTEASNYRTSITKMPPSIISNGIYGVELRIAKGLFFALFSTNSFISCIKAVFISLD